jgi:O-antigen/teichoic acid export membrane protein
MKNLWDLIKQKFEQVKDLGYFGSANIIGTGIAALFWFYLANTLEVEEFGKIQYYLAIAGIAYVITSFATANTITVYSAKNIKIISTLILISITGGIIAFLTILSIFQRIDIGLIIFGFIISDLSLYYLLGKKFYSKYSKNFIVQKILMVVFSISFYHLFGLEAIIYGIALSYIHYTIIIYKVFKESEVNFSLLRSRKGFITNNYLETLIGGLRGEIDKIIIAPMLGFVILGNYALAIQVYLVLMIFSNVIFKYILPQDSSGGSSYKLKQISVFIASGISILGIAVLPIIIPYLFPKYEDAIIAIQITSLSIVPATIGFLYISKFLSLEKSKFILIGRIIGLSTISLGMFILPPYFDIVGVASAFVLSTFAQTIFFVLMYEKIKVKKEQNNQK